MLNDRLSRWLMRSVPDYGVNLINGMPIAIGSDIGLNRKENQDRIAILRVNTNSPTSHPFIAIALADGMGGMLNGSECAARTLGAFFNALIRFRQKRPEERLLLSANAANDAVSQFSNSGGGATLSAALFDTERRAFTVNVGDSRIYATKRDCLEEGVIRLTVDDSLEEAVGGHGKDLLQFIGMGEGLIPHISVMPDNLDKIVITSDGVHFVSKALLNDILTHADSQQKAVEQMLTVAKWRGGPDNASIATVLTKGLVESLIDNQESGIEVWDPFSSLHVMWARQEHTDTKDTDLAYQAESSAHLSDSPAHHEPPPQLPTSISKPRGSRKTRATRKPKRPARGQDQQMTIEIGPAVKPSNNEGIDDDNP